MMEGQIRIIDGEYWINIEYESMTLLFEMKVRGKVASRAMREIFIQQEKAILEGGQLLESLEEIVHWGMMASSKGNKTLDTMVRKLAKIVNRYRPEDIIPD